MKKVKLHIDDFLLTKHITLNHLNLIKKYKKNISGISCIVNTLKNTKFFFNKLSIKKKNIYLHLNLTDGKPVNKNVYRIINKKGYFNLNFFKLFMIRLHPNFSKFKIEIRKEIIEQINKYLILIKNKDKIKNKKKYKIYLDSHQHIHMIPWIFKLIIDLKKSYNICFIRTINEPIIIDNLKIFFFPWFYKNLIKLILLKILNHKNLNKLNKSNIKTNNFFFGILRSGYMTKNYLNKINSKFFTKNYQILIHPNIAKQSEYKILGCKKKLKYFLRPERKYEEKILKL